MKTKNIILKLRTERGMSQDELADKIMVTRQAVSRWENGDTVPNTDTLKNLMFQSIRFWENQESCSASAVECQLMMIPYWDVIRMAH